MLEDGVDINSRLVKHGVVVVLMMCLKKVIVFKDINVCVFSCPEQLNR